MNKKYIAIILVFFIALSSCNKKLDLTPTDTIDVTKAFTSVADLEKGLLGVYSANNITNKIYIASALADARSVSICATTSPTVFLAGFALRSELSTAW